MEQYYNNIYIYINILYIIYSKSSQRVAQVRHTLKVARKNGTPKNATALLPSCSGSWQGTHIAQTDVVLVGGRFGVPSCVMTFPQKINTSGYYVSFEARIIRQLIHVADSKHVVFQSAVHLTDKKLLPLNKVCNEVCNQCPPHLCNTIIYI